MEWLEPWWSTEELPQAFRDSFKRQLELEVGPEHVVHGLPVRLIGRGNGDDALFEILDGTVESLMCISPGVKGLSVCLGQSQLSMQALQNGLRLE